VGDVGGGFDVRFSDRVGGLVDGLGCSLLLVVLELLDDAFETVLEER
jgi:hypothetical protein